MNHLGIDYEDTLSTYVGSSDGINYEKNVGLLIDDPVIKREDVKMVGSGCGP